MNLFNYNTNDEWDYENGFYITSKDTRLFKFISQYELYKMIVNLPGDIFEFGVFKGASLIRFATFRNALETQHSRKIIGFDIFGKFPTTENINDNKFIEKFEEQSGTGIPIEELYKILEYKNMENIELLKGDINQTLPQYLNNNPQTKISLLHIDIDVYKPTKLILETLFDKVVKGGIIMLDDYSTVEGETLAVDEFFDSKDCIIQKLPYYKTPSYIIKK